MESLESLWGTHIVTDPHLTKTAVVEVRRTWRERLFSRPWRPWERTKFVTRQVPDDTVYFIRGRIVCHPIVRSQMERVIRGG